MVVSLIGTWMQSVAQSWLVYRLTHSEFLLGVTWFCTHIPVLVLAPVGGLAADRFSRHRIVVTTQTLSMLQALGLAALTLSGHIQVWHIMAFALMLGTINAFDIPGRQSLFVELVGREELLNAISLNSAIFNLARVAGPSVAGFLVAALGEGMCFLLNGLSFVAVIGSLLAMRLNRTGGSTSKSSLSNLLDGFRYARRAPAVAALLVMSAAVNLSSAPVVALAPVFADGIFGQGSLGLGLATGAMGVGAVAGVLTLARRDGVAGLPSVIFQSGCCMAISALAIAWAPSFSALLLAMVVTGFGVFRQNAAANTLIQSVIPDEYRGRIMAIYTMMVIGFLPIGSLAAGSLGHVIGARWTVFAAGSFCLVAAAVFGLLLPRFQKWIGPTFN